MFYILFNVPPHSGCKPAMAQLILIDPVREYPAEMDSARSKHPKVITISTRS